MRCDCQTLVYTSPAAQGTINFKALRDLSIVPECVSDGSSQADPEDRVFSLRMVDDSGLEVEFSGKYILFEQEKGGSVFNSID